MEQAFSEKFAEALAHIMTVNDEPRVHPGLDEATIRATFAELELEPPEDLVHLYEQYNGIHNLNAFLSFMPLSEALEIYDIYKDVKGGVADFSWQESWFPVFDMNGDVQICLDCETSALIAIDLECGTEVQIAPHHGPYLDAVLSVLRRRLFEFDEVAGRLVVSREVWERVTQEFRIKSAW